MSSSTQPGVSFSLAGLDIPVRIAYTSYQRHKTSKKTFPTACDALSGTTGYTTLRSDAEPRQLSLGSEEDDVDNQLHELDMKYDGLNQKALMHSADVKEKETMVTSDAVSELSEITSDLSLVSVSHLAAPIAILPQFITQEPTTIKISELTFPHLNSQFTVTDKNSTNPGPILRIHRDFPSLVRRQRICNGVNDQPLLTIRRLRGRFPRSYSFVDPEGTRVAEVQGNFFVPYTGARATMVFTNACDGQTTKLSMHGAFKNRRAVIRLAPPEKEKKSKDDNKEKERKEKEKEKGPMLASMSSELFTLKNLTGRRDYEVQVGAGVDIVLIVAMITALDARAN